MSILLLQSIYEPKEMLRHRFFFISMCGQTGHLLWHMVESNYIRCLSWLFRYIGGKTIPNSSLSSAVGHRKGVQVWSTKEGCPWAKPWCSCPLCRMPWNHHCIITGPIPQKTESNDVPIAPQQISSNSQCLDRANNNLDWILSNRIPGRWMAMDHLLYLWAYGRQQMNEV